MRIWLFLALFLCIITLCVSDDSGSSESSETYRRTGRGGAGRRNNYGRDTVRTNQRGRGNDNANRQGSKTGGQQNMDTGNSNKKGQNTDSTNQQGKKDENIDQQGTKQDTGSQKAKDTDKTTQGTTIVGANNQQTTAVQGTTSPERVIDQKNVDPCDLKCTPTTNPRRRVCGSDGVTYDTFCFLKKARCGKPNLKFVGRGTCPPSSTDSDEEPTEPVDPCDLECTPTNNPRGRVCGSDGVTYDTFCFLKKARCGKPNLKFVGRGTCPPSSTDSNEEPTEPVDPCDLKCTPTNNPRGRVCGSDGVTYDTFCFLKKARCGKPNLKFVGRGTCPPSSTESDEESTEPVDPCDLECTPTNNPRGRVCGSDGVTYDTFCFLKKARCGKPNLKFVGRGTCPPSSTESDEESTEPVTTEEAPTTPPRKTPVTLSPEIPTTPRDVATTTSPTTELFNSTIGMEENITFPFVNNDTTVASQTEVAPRVTTQAPLNMTGNFSVPDEGTTMPSRNTDVFGTTQPFVVDCPNLCPIIRELVCGTDGTTYQSPCVLQLVACVNNDPTLMVASLGPCPPSTLEPISAL